MSFFSVSFTADSIEGVTTLAQSGYGGRVMATAGAPLPSSRSMQTMARDGATGLGEAAPPPLHVLGGADQVGAEGAGPSEAGPPPLLQAGAAGAVPVPNSPDESGPPPLAVLAAVARPRGAEEELFPPAPYQVSGAAGGEWEGSPPPLAEMEAVSKVDTFRSSGEEAGPPILSQS
jgi:hypothetical protein